MRSSLWSISQPTILSFRKFVCLMVLNQQEIKTDSSGRRFVAADFNREGDSHRSPYTNEYVPEIQEGYKPSLQRRMFQQKVNVLFDQYTKLYYDAAGVGSFFICDSDYGFSCAYFATKQIQAEEDLRSGSWNSFNFMEVKVQSDHLKVNYKLRTTVLVELGLQSEQMGRLRICGFLERNSQRTQSFQNQKQLQNLHFQIIGSMIEDNQNNLRKQLEVVETDKTKEVLMTTRFLGGRLEVQNKIKLAKQFKMFIKMPAK